jgi:hypothetical protein
MIHFHKNNIIYRDLKPENIGFDIGKDVKFFVKREATQWNVPANWSYWLP